MQSDIVGEFGPCRAVAATACWGNTQAGAPKFECKVKYPDGSTAMARLYFSDGKSEAETQKRFDRNVASMRAMGAQMQNDDLADLTGIGETDFWVTNQENTYNGETTVQIGWINREPKPKMEGAAVQSFAARMRANVARARLKEAATTPAPEAKLPELTPATAPTASWGTSTAELPPEPSDVVPF